MKRLCILGATLSALIVGTIVPVSLYVHYSSDVWRGGALIASTLGIVPLDVVRVLAILMAAHYLLHLPKVLRNAHARIKGTKRFAKKCFNGLVGALELSVKVAVPVLFYAVFVGGHSAHEAANHIPLA